MHILTQRAFVVVVAAVLLSSATAAEVTPFSELPKGHVHITIEPSLLDGGFVSAYQYVPTGGKLFRCVGQPKQPMGRMQCTEIESGPVKSSYFSEKILKEWRRYGEPQEQMISIIALPELNPPFQQSVFSLILIDRTANAVHLCRRVEHNYEFETLIRGHVVYLYSEKPPYVRESCQRVYPSK